VILAQILAQSAVLPSHCLVKLPQTRQTYTLAFLANVVFYPSSVECRDSTVREAVGFRLMRKETTMKTKSSRFDSLVARYYPTVYSFATRLTDDPREALVLTRDAFNITRKQLQNRRDEAALASILISAVIRAGLTAA